jgi:hypothetical protein
LDFEIDSVNTVESEELGDDELDVDVLQLKSNIFPRGLVPL